MQIQCSMLQFTIVLQYYLGGMDVCCMRPLLNLDVHLPILGRKQMEELSSRETFWTCQNLGKRDNYHQQMGKKKNSSLVFVNS